jgi:predicted DNA-binding transcriptional regulator AlpA
VTRFGFLTQEPNMSYLSKQALAEKLFVTVRSISTYMTKGLLPPPMQLGRRLLWDENDIEAWLRAQQLLVSSPKINNGKKKIGRPRKFS